MTRNEFRVVDEKFLMGDHMTDEELHDMIVFYRSLFTMADFLDERFAFFTQEILRRAMRLEDYERAREESKKRSRTPW